MMNSVTKPKGKQPFGGAIRRMLSGGPIGDQNTGTGTGPADLGAAPAGGMAALLPTPTPGKDRWSTAVPSAPPDLGGAMPALPTAGAGPTTPAPEDLASIHPTGDDTDANGPMAAGAAGDPTSTLMQAAASDPNWAALVAVLQEKGILNG